MNPMNMSRRRFVSLMGLGSLSIGGLGVVAGCTADSKSSTVAPAGAAATQVPTAAKAQATDTAMPGMNMGTGSANQSSGNSGSDELTPDQMDAADADAIKKFLANQEKPITEGKGGQPLAFTMDGDTKVFTLTTSKIRWETTPGEVQDAYSFNGALPGPEIRVTEGDKLRVIVRNGMPISTAIHWHGLMVPNKQDGVGNLTQPPIKPGQTYTYEFVAKPAGTHMYHSHLHAMTEVGGGLLGALIVEPRDKSNYPKYDREYTMVLNDTLLGFTINGKGFPATDAFTAKKGETVLFRFMNEGNMNHPMHLHGMPMKVYAVDGYPLPNPYMCDTLDVAPGNRYEVFVEATEEGAWAFHCHILAHAEGDHGMFGLVTALVVTA